MNNSNIFSIEIFLDRIRLLEGEKCYFPSTVLKLLNYEPALISTVDYDVQTKLHEYLNIIENSKNKKRILQIDELKDCDGNYVVRKGKSILFEAETLALISEFNTLPLYILICDDFFKPSHLVGVVTIKLSETMIKLSKRISQVSHTVSEDIFGKFPIVNLMGDGIGIITLKLRLIYIGANLAPHLPKVQEIEIKPRTKLIDPVSKSVGISWKAESEETVQEIVVKRNIGCQVDKNRNICIQVVSKPLEESHISNNLANVGLTIDPTDPVLTDLPPMIYNSYYRDSESNSILDHSLENSINREPPDTTKKNVNQPRKPKNNFRSSSGSPKRLPVLNALLHELQSWKSQENLDSSHATQRPIRAPNKSFKKPKASSQLPRSKSVDVVLHNESRQEFYRRMSRPKPCPPEPLGLVPEHRGWLRTTPVFSGARNSARVYRTTRTVAQRVAMHRPSDSTPRDGVFTSGRRLSSPIRTDHSSPSPSPLPRQKRNPLVPPLFGAGTSVSAPSFSVTGDSSEAAGPPDRHRSDKVVGHPPLSPNKDFGNRNNNHHLVNSGSNRSSPGKEVGNRHNSRHIGNSKSSRSGAGCATDDADDTVNEADQFLNLNPVQSNRSPHMSMRPARVESSRDEPISYRDYDDEDQGDEDENDEHGDSNRYGQANNMYSDEFNEDYSSDEHQMRSMSSRRHSNASPISQTSEWRTDYSVGSFNSQNNVQKVNSQDPSPDLGTYRSPPRSPMKPKRSLLANGVLPGGRFLEGTTSNSFKSFDSYKPSLLESSEVSNIDESRSVLHRHGYRPGHSDVGPQSVRDMEINASLLRPGSPGADVTSFTKVTKYERSGAPGPHTSTNYLAGTHLVTSTVGSFRTDDSQILTSGSYYEHM